MSDLIVTSGRSLCKQAFEGHLKMGEIPLSNNHIGARSMFSVSTGQVERYQHHSRFESVFSRCMRAPGEKKPQIFLN